MIGYIVIIYWVLALSITYNIGMNIQGVSVLLNPAIISSDPSQLVAR